tara:strand:- start:4447 stop:5367 length:921 start_codon:yes stop_codon:yes gene_type:complete
MPREHFGPGHTYLDRSDLLDFEELTRLASIFTELGVRKIRLTGGEPLLRRGLPLLVEQLKVTTGIQIAMTTNGSLLAAHAESLKAAGLDRVTVSLDSLHDASFQAINDVDFGVDRVLQGIDAALRADLRPVKINAVIKRGVNDSQLVELASYARERGITLRLIEFMDVGGTNRWNRQEVVGASEMLATIGAAFPLREAPPQAVGEVARRYAYLDGSGELGIIASVSAPFCGSCSRARISADGKLFTCLFASSGLDLRRPLREGASNSDLRALISATWSRRDDRYSELRRRRKTLAAEPVEMSYIGG